MLPVMMSLLPFSRYIVTGESMIPTLKKGSSVLTLNWYYQFAAPKVNEIIVAEINQRKVIKRIKKIKKNQVWLEGDNPSESTDSRSFGWVDQKKIIAKVIYIA